MDDQIPPTIGPPPESQWPPENLEGGEPRKFPTWGKWLTGIGIVLIVVALAGSFIRVPYDTLSPGGSLDLAQRVSIRDAKADTDRGEVRLLFVRERAHINLWSWLQAKLDSDIDLVKQVDVTGGKSQQQADEQSVCDMSQSQVEARVAALRALGYEVPVLRGLDVRDLPPYFLTAGKAKDDKPIEHPLPAIKVLKPCDAIVAADGHDLKDPGDLSKIVRGHRVGSKVALRIIRNGHTKTVSVPVVAGPENPVVGVDLALRYKLPVRIDIDTNDIGGPSAGLAMALAIVDALTPGDITGGKPVAVTGTIDGEGNVGEIGGLPQKAVAARASGAKIFIVPKCGSDECRKDLASARRRVGKGVQLSPVSTLEEALKVLHDAGGAPVEPRRSSQA